MTAARSDEELMAAYAGGSFEAFEELFERNRRSVFMFLLHHVGERELAEDLMQDVFLRVVRARERYVVGSRFRPWLFTIVRNAVTDSHRRRAVRRVVVLEGDLETGAREEERERAPSVGAAGLGAQSSAAEQPADLAAAADLRVAIEAAVARLPEEQREVFLLRERGELDFESIARVTGQGLATVKSRMRYAMAALRRSLSQLEKVVFE